MTIYVLRRLLQAIAVIWMTFTLTFFLLYMMPGDPVHLMLSDGGNAGTYVDPAAAQKLREELGFTKPWYERYFAALFSILSGDFGNSITQRQPVRTLLAEAIPSTIEVTILALAIAISLGGAVALAASYWRDHWISSWLLAIPAFSVSLPSFWVGIVLIQIFSFSLHLFPAFGNDGIRSAVLPALTLGIYFSATVAQVMNSSLREAESQPFVQTALARGASRLRILWRHIAVNASVVSLTTIGMVTGGLLAGAMITETVFTRSGIGKLLVNSVQTHDFPVLLATVVFVAASYTLVNLVVDIILPLIDPRLISTVRKSHD